VDGEPADRERADDGDAHPEELLDPLQVTPPAV
jgi:hypothetical protein